VQRSRIELDLDRVNEALIDLQQVVRTYPTDPATFTALYLIGVCHFELDQLDEAEAAWKGILTSEQLAPSAVEWRDAQLSLGQLLYQKGDLKRREIFSRTTANVIQTYKDAARDWQEAAQLLSRYLDRNQTGQGVVEARYYLGKSLQREAELLGRQLEIAETDNARQQLQSQRDATLFKSLKQFELLKEELTTRQADDQIDELQQRILKNCFFEIPHTWFELRDYDKAISNYNAAINKYPQDVQTLVAYIQMGQCHHRHSPPRPIEARNMLQQAILLLSHKQIPDENFLVPSTNFSSIEWQRWLERARQVD
jgi:tetratricopeptide (TPR) repeat protein